MSGETEKDVSGWTVDTLFQHFEARLELTTALLQERHEAQTQAMETAFEAQKTAMQAALASAEKAVIKAESASEKRFESVNEFRQQLGDQASTFMGKAESNARHDATTDKIDGIVMMNEKRIESILERLNANALAIERVNATGQTIYLLRGEAITQQKHLDDKIIMAQVAAARDHKLAIDAVADLRTLVTEQATKMMPRTESETRTTAYTEQLQKFEVRMQAYPTRDETAVALNAADAKLATGLGSVTEKTNSLADRLAAVDLRLSSRMDLASGKGQGMNAMWALTVGGIGLIIMVILFANTFIGSQ